MERRGHERVPFEARVSLVCDRPLTRIVGRTVNLSRAGLFVATPQPPARSTGLAFEVLGDGGACMVKGHGEVVWVRLTDAGPKRPAGVAIRFIDLNEIGRRRVHHLLKSRGEVQLPVPRVASTRFHPLENATWFNGSGAPGEVAGAADDGGASKPRLRIGAGERRRFAVLISVLLVVVCVAVAVVTVGSRLRLFGSSAAPVEPVLAATSVEPAPVATSGSAAPQGPDETVDPQDEVAAATLAPAKRLRAISSRAWSNETVVTIVADGSLDADSVRSFRMQDPPRHVVRIKGLTGDHPRQSMDAASRQVAGIRVGWHDDVSPPEVSVVMDFVSADVMLRNVEVSGERLVLRFGERLR